MRTNKTKSYLMGFLLASVVSTPLAAKSKEKLLNRSIYMPIDFELCEHLGDGVLYENDRLISMMPAGRMFQFTYYADRKVLLPEQVRGVDSLDRDGELQLLKQRKKIDKRLKKRTIRLACKRYCKRERRVAAQ